jgi:protoporphyrinogen oxidase
MDIGGHRFFSKDERIMDWWRSVLPLQGAPSYDDARLGRPSHLEEGGPDPATCDDVMLRRHRVSRIYWNHHFFDYPISLKPATFRNMGFAQAMRVGLSYLGSCVHKLPEDSLESFYVNRFGRALYQMFFEGYTEKLWGRHPSQISADWGAQRVKGVSVGALLKNAVGHLVHRGEGTSGSAEGDKKVETSLIEEFWYPKYGPGQLWEKVARLDADAGCDIRLNSRVTGITEEAGEVRSVTYIDEGGVSHELPCDVLVSSMPLKDLVRAFDAGASDAAGASQPVPADVREVSEGLPYRDFVTVGLLVDRLELPNRTAIPTLGDPPIVPDCWIYVQDSSVKVGRIQVFNNWSPYLVADVEDTVWVGLEYFCDEGDDFWEKSEADTVAQAISELTQMGIIRGPECVRDTHRERVRKAYPAYFDTYDRIDELVGWLDSHPNLFCVGRNGQHRYNNMDHSMATAFAAVEDIRAGITDRTNVWSVNTEESYQETKGAE